MRAFKKYLTKQQEKLALGLISRKFSYMRRLKAVLRLFRANVTYQKDFRRRVAESTTLHKRNMLARFFKVFKEVDAAGREREAKLFDMLDTKR